MKISSHKFSTILDLSSKGFALTLSLLVMIRWWYYINNYSVNILFWDQWDFYDAFFESHNLWEVFRW